ncbi:unnamed protein product [Caenorhabditis angaria]|uniref:ABC transporter domain-containing protein n=1 Tax=Caenorhabditis angaria TaxID=860376 RepID=A0A9P1IFY0_9PELO|nr:unnamed protein product [Caenorhabditis angaria]
MSSIDNSKSLKTASSSKEYSALNDFVQVSLQWRDLFVVAKKESRDLLIKVNGIAKSGELLALMGASGAGKTTLLNYLMHRNLKGLKTEGTITVNGNEMGNAISLISGFAQQEELFIPTLTVKEHLLIQAKLRIKANSKIRNERVEEVMQQLKLWKCRDSKIGKIGHEKGISGGEARRLTFASEMLSNPSILFCDEPTSGLDSFMAENVVEILKGIAKTGRTIICTIHQPSSQLYQMFDRVIYLAAGRTAFYGSPQESIEFFENCGHKIPDEYNPSEWIIYKLAVQPGDELASNARISEIISAFDKSEYNQKMIGQLGINADKTPPPFIQKANIFIQFGALLKRCALDVWRCPQLAIAKVIQKLVFGFFLAALYFRTEYDTKGVQNINGALFFIGAELFFSTSFAIINFTNSEFPLIAREIHDGLYNASSYFVARCVSLVPLFTFDSILFIYLVYWFIGFNSSFQQVLYASILTLVTSQAASATGITMSCICPTPTMTAVVASPIMVLVRVFSGLYGNLSTFPPFIRWIRHISPLRYVCEGFLVNQWSSIDDFHPELKNNYTDAIRDEILNYYAFSSDNIYLDIYGLVIYTLVVLLIGFIAFLIRVKRAR